MAKAFPGMTALTNALGQTLYIETPTYDLINKLLDLGSNLFLVGPAGVAKTEVANAIFVERGLDPHIYQMETGAVSSGDQLDGERTLDTDGKLAVIPSELLKAAKAAHAGSKVGFIADELNRVGAAGAVNKLLRLYGGQREYVSDLDGVLRVGNNMLTMATANVGYHGTVRLNEALLDRFDPIEMRPIAGKVLCAMLEERYPTVSTTDIAKVASFSDAIQKAFDREPDGDLRPISTRDAQRIVRGIAAGLTPVEAVTKLVGGQLMIQQRPVEAIDALVTQAKAKFA